MFYMLKKKKYILLMFQNNPNCEKQVILLMISNGENAKLIPAISTSISCSQKLSSLLKEIVPKDHVFYCLNCLHFFRTKIKLESHKDFCNNITKYTVNIATLKYQNLINTKNLIKHQLLFMQILNEQMRGLMDIKIIMKIHLQQK